ncbi:MAG: hypothetical protein ACXAD7_05220 [Candidatus Kariarchaeaceae archaeon]
MSEVETSILTQQDTTTEISTLTKNKTIYDVTTTLPIEHSTTTVFEPTTEQSTKIEEMPVAFISLILLFPILVTVKRKKTST